MGLPVGAAELASLGLAVGAAERTVGLPVGELGLLVEPTSVGAMLGASVASVGDTLGASVAGVGAVLGASVA